MTVSVERLDAPTVRRDAGDGFAPLLRCDDCGREISKPGSGRVEATWKQVGGPIRTAPLGDYLESLERFL